MIDTLISYPLPLFLRDPSSACLYSHQNLFGISAARAIRNIEALSMFISICQLKLLNGKLMLPGT